MYLITWTDGDGTQLTKTFRTRFQAVLFLNVLVLDYGVADAKLRKLPGKAPAFNSPRIFTRES